MRSDANDEQSRLQEECWTFARYLLHREPDTYVVKKYVEYHAAVLRGAPATLPIDRALVRFASGGPFRARIADAYARMFRPYGLLRRKLILLLAILENSRAHYRGITSGGDGDFWAAWLRIGSSMAGFLAALILGMAMFLPRHLFSLGAGRTPRK